MRLHAFGLFGLAVFAAVASVAACDDGGATPCVPGQSVTCGGPAGCEGFQVCKADGSGFDACVCAAETSSTASGSSVSSSAGSGGASSSSSVGSSSSGAGGAAPFLPTDLPGLSLWLHAEAGVIPDPQHPGTVLKWLDQSPNAHVGVATNTQDGFRFDIDPLAINGHDAMRCRSTGVFFSIADHPSLRFGTQPFTIAAVVKAHGQNQGIGGFYAKNAAEGHGMSLQSEVNGSFNFLVANGGLNVVAASPDLGKFHLVVVRGPKLELRVGENVSLGPLSTDDIDNVGAPVALCSAPLPASIAEVVAVKGALAEAQLDELLAYLRAKYAL